MTVAGTGVPAALAVLMLTAVPDRSNSALSLEPSPQAAAAARPTGEWPAGPSR